MLRNMSPVPFRRPFAASEFADRDTIPCPAPTPLDLVAEGLHVDLSSPEAESVVALLGHSDAE